MNYITLINRFWDSAMTNPLSTGQVSLYFALLHICNRSNWTEWFQAPNQVLSVLTGLSRSGILKARNELKQRGLIDFRERGTKATIYSLSTLSTAISNSTQDSVQDGAQTGMQNSVRDSKQTGMQNSNTIKRNRNRQDKKSISNEIQEKCAQNSVPEAVREALERYVGWQESVGMPFSDAAFDMLLKRLDALAPQDPASQAAILEQSIRRQWKDIFPLSPSKGAGGGKAASASRNRFHNLESHGYDYDRMVWDMVGAGKTGENEGN